MDPGTAIGVTSLGIQVCQRLLDYYCDWRSYNKDIAAFTDSITELLGFFKDVQETLNTTKSTAHEGPADLLKCADEALVKCREDVETLKAELDTVGQYQDKDEICLKLKLKEQLRRALYPFRKGTLGDLQDIANDTKLFSQKSWECFRYVK